MAVLQIVDEAEENTHNYADTSIYGHSENYHRDDIYGNYTGTTTASDGTTPLPYNHSIFDAESSNTSNP